MSSHRRAGYWVGYGVVTSNGTTCVTGRQVRIAIEELPLSRKSALLAGTAIRVQ